MKNILGDFCWNCGCVYWKQPFSNMLKWIYAHLMRPIQDCGYCDVTKIESRMLRELKDKYRK